MYAAMSLGADGVQIGSRFVATVESSAHQKFKRAVIDAEEGATKLVLKKLVPVRLIKNKFFEMVEEAEQSGASKNDLIKLLGRGRAKSGMYEGDIQNGELEIGQVSGMINSISSVNQVIEEIIREFNQVSSKMSGIKL
jgi:enoyl-[acyl-carrier protein] reductase II